MALRRVLSSFRPQLRFGEATQGARVILGLRNRDLAAPVCLAASYSTAESGSSYQSQGVRGMCPLFKLQQRSPRVILHELLSSYRPARTETIMFCRVACDGSGLSECCSIGIGDP